MWGEEVSFLFFGEEKGFEFEYLREKSGLLKVILSVQGDVANAKDRDTPGQDFLRRNSEEEEEEEETVNCN